MDLRTEALEAVIVAILEGTVVVILGEEAMEGEAGTAVEVAGSDSEKGYYHVVGITSSE